MTTIIAFVIVVGTLVIVHEFGHYLVARLVGVRVETFSIGFPPTIFRHRIGPTDFVIGLLPLGGFVKMAGDIPGRGTGDPEELQNRTRGERLAILLAGPAMNFLLAILILAGLFWVGLERRVGLSDPPVVSYVAADSPAGTAGVRAGDRILALGGDPVADWRGVLEYIAVRPDREVVFTVDRGGAPQEIPVRVEGDENAIGVSGVYPPAPALVGEVGEGTPAEAAGLLPGDRIVGVDGAPVGSVREVQQIVLASGVRPLELTLEREGRTLALPVTPELVEQPEGGPLPRIGVQFAPPMRMQRAASAGAALREAVVETARWGRLTVEQLGRLVGGSASPRQFSGPIGIAQASGEALRRGPTETLLLMAVLSLSLGVLNLLPIPVLDGGQIAVLLIESAVRRDLSARVRQGLMIAGAALMLVIFVLVILLDLSRTGLLSGLFS